MPTTTHIAIEKIISSGEYGTIFLARDKNSHKRIKCVCKKHGYKEGSAYSIVGDWISHPKHGNQLKISKSKSIQPPSNIYEALSQSDIWPGLTPKRLAKIRDYALKNELNEEEIMNNLGHLKKTFNSTLEALNIRKGWLDVKAYIPLAKPLSAPGLKIDDAFAIARQLDGHSRKIALESPYQILIAPSANMEIAESLHHTLGITPNITNAINPLYYRFLASARSKGNTGEVLTDVAKSIHRSSRIPIEDIMKTISQDRVVMNEEEYSVVQSIFRKEASIAKKICSMSSKTNNDLDRIAGEYQGDDYFTEEQKIAVQNAILKPFTVITGGPGTGKTTTIKEVIKNLESSGYEADIVTLSGKAADRASEASGREASTIHSYLGITPTSAKSQKSFSGRAIIVDEASMVDTNLLYQLMSSLDDTCKIVLVGDINQLESIDPGAILEDISTALSDSVTHLTKVQRFSEDSHINNFANQVLKKEILYAKTNGLYTYTSSSDKHQLNTNLKIIESYINRHGNIDDLQVISPTWKGENGVISLNKLIQDMIPRRDENVLILGNKKLYEGDKVIVRGEISSQGLSTGQMLKISAIDYEKNTMHLTSGDRQFSISISDTSMLSLAYCITGHSSQGSEFKNVLFSITPQSEKFADKKMLYTIATRAKENLIITTPEGCMEKILENDKIKRKTFLSDLITDQMAKKMRHQNEYRKTHSPDVAMQ